MQKISELLTKPLICLYEATQAGFVKNILFDKMLYKAQVLELFCEDEFEPEQKFVNFKDIFQSNGDALVVKFQAAVFFHWQKEADTLNSPINAAVFTTHGKARGRVSDIILNEKGGVEQILCDNEEVIKRNQIVSVSEKLLIIQDKLPIKLSKPKPKIIKADNRTVSILNIAPSIATQNAAQGQNTPPSEAPPTPSPPKETVIKESLQEPPQKNYTHYRVLIDNSRPNGVSIPERLPSDNVEVSRSPLDKEGGGYSFLLGRQVKSDILGVNSQVLVAKGQLIDANVIELCKINNRIVQLALNS